MPAILFKKCPVYIGHFLLEYFYLQVNLCQKLLFLHQPKFQAQTWGEQVVYRNCFWHSEHLLYTTCSPLVWARNFHDIQWTICRHMVGWCKNKSFWRKFTCTWFKKNYFSVLNLFNNSLFWFDLIWSKKYFD